MKNSFFIVSFSLISFSYSFGNTPLFVSIGDTTKKESPNRINLAKNNCYLISGTVGSEETQGSNAFVMKIDSTGKTIWHSVLAYDTFNQASGVIETDSNSYFVFGSSYSPHNENLTENGSIYLITYSHAWIAHLDSSGKNLWTKKLTDSLRLIPQFVFKQNNGNFVIACEEYYGGFYFRVRTLTLTQEGQILSSYFFDEGTVVNDMCQMSNGTVYFTGATNRYRTWGDECLGSQNYLLIKNHGYRGTEGYCITPSNDQSYFWIAGGWYTTGQSGIKVRYNGKEAFFDNQKPPHNFSPFRCFQFPNNNFSVICRSNFSDSIGLLLLDSQLSPLSFQTIANTKFKIKDAVKNSKNQFACVGISSLDSTMQFGIVIPDTNETKVKVRNIEIRNSGGYYLNQLDQAGSLDILGRKFDENKSTSMQIYISELNRVYSKKLTGNTVFR